MISSKGRYALRVMIDLARQDSDGYVPLKETIRGFKMILDGECDELPESAFLFCGTIDDAFAKAKNQ